MKLWFVGAGLLCILLPAAMALVCYKCESTVSWQRCKTTTLTCHADRNRCGKVHFKNGDSETFIKRCFPEDQCVKEGNFYCQRADECDVTCCDTYECNAGSAFSISGVLLMTCVLASLMTLVKA